MDVSNINKAAENWNTFEKQWKNYEIATEMNTKSEEVRVAILKAVMGTGCAKVLENLNIPAAEENKVIYILQYLREHYEPRKNIIYERYLFYSSVQEENESINQYINRLRKLATTCDFLPQVLEENIRDRIVLGIKNKNIMKKLLEDRNLTLNKAIDVCQSNELAEMHMLGLTSKEETINMHKEVKNKKYKTNNEKGKSNNYKQCKFCGNKHEWKKELCPAYGKTCKKCTRKNHFAKVCNTKIETHKTLHTVEETQDIQSSDESVYKVTNKQEHKQLITKLILGYDNKKQIVLCQMDTGATCNVIGFKQLCKILDTTSPKLTENSIKLKCYGGQLIKPIGETVLKCWYKEKRYNIHFQVVETEQKPLLGAQCCAKLDLIKVNAELFKLESKMKEKITREQIIEEFEDVFTGLGKLPGEYHIEVDRNVRPTQQPPRKVPVAIKEKVIEKIKELEKNGIIEKVVTPTDWISNIIVVQKANKIRICLDPRDLNIALKRAHYQIPTIEDILPDLTKAKVFSVLDAKDGFWQVQLDEESSKLTTFWTPIGRYCWRRMPFGISTAPEEYQRRQHEVLQGLPGIAVIADDILVYGCGDTEETAIQDHDTKLKAVLERARSVNLKLNKQKMKIKMKMIKYMGHILTQEGLKPDPEKIKAITDAPRPTNKTEIQSFLGCVTYLSKFVPRLSELTEPIRILTHQNIEWIWDITTENAFQKIKHIISHTPILCYYDVNKPVTIQCDASSYGVGAVLLQEGMPVAFASRTLTETERNGYVQLERECLAILFGCNKFHQYIVGRNKIKVETDHQPLETIFKKSIFKVTKRLQRMILHLKRYDIEVKYIKGSQMYIADFLSRMPIKEKDNLKLYETIAKIDMTQHVNLTEERLKQIQQHTALDNTLQNVIAICLSGWPDKRSDTPTTVHEFWNYREEIGVQNGIVFKGTKVIIPQTMRKEMLKRIHASHLGAEACVRRAKDVIFWPLMKKEIYEEVKKCKACQETEISQQKEPLITHITPSRPWERIGIDLFMCQNKNYLITVDYFSDFWEMDELEDTTAETLIKTCKKNFSRHGIPDIVDSDVGTQINCKEFKQFTKDWEFDLITSSPHHHKSNGKAESAVKIAKKLIKRTTLEDADLWKAILEWRNTPTQNMGCSPVQRLMSRRTKALLPISDCLLRPKTEKQVKEKIERRKIQYKYQYDKHAKELPSLVYGQNVRVQLNPARRADPWRSAVVRRTLDNRSYVVDVNGHEFRRNRVHIRTTEDNKEEIENQDLTKNCINEKIEKETVPHLPSKEKSSVTTEAIQQSPRQNPPSSTAETEDHQAADMKHSEDTTHSNSIEPTRTRSGRVVNKPRRYNT